jgi:predicted amidophosphoribosyltransferase
VRGYDHIDIVCSEFAKQRGFTKRNVLKRKNNFVQHKATKNERKKQADKAFECNEVLDLNAPYLIIDDIVTTGSTIKAATRVLKGAGAKEVWVAAIARQPLN